MYELEGTVVPGDYQSVASLFARSLSSASGERPLYLFLDGVDQLSPEDGASGMSWLPLTLPAHVKLVLSTSSEPEYRSFPVLQSLLAKHPASMVQVYARTSSVWRNLCGKEHKNNIIEQIEHGLFVKKKQGHKY